MKELSPISNTTSTVETTTAIYPIEDIDPQYATIEVTTTIVNGGEPKISFNFNNDYLKRDGFRLQLVKKEFFEYIKKGDPFDSYKNKAIQSCLVNIDDVIVYDNGHLYLDKMDLEFIWKSAYSLLMDMDGQLIPYARSYDYCGTYFNNEDIDLNDEFLEFLRNHPWVVNKDELEVEEIPYYNRSKDRNKSILVKVCPDKETYNKMAEEAKKQNRKLWTYFLPNYVVSTYESKKDWFGIAPYLKVKRNFEV